MINSGEKLPAGDIHQVKQDRYHLEIYSNITTIPSRLLLGFKQPGFDKRPVEHGR